ncbi:hypothetical protein X566_24060 [Afipia sp. P52-10]|jgi:hypothetical protein|nr:hypothetical protein X566_24060 [Afipia sp. P52-10]
MLFTIAAASAAVDILSQLVEKASAKNGGGGARQTGFEIAAPAQPVESSISSPVASAPTENLSREMLDTLLSAQGQAQGVERKKRSLSVLLDLMQTSQNGSVSKTEFDAAAGSNGSKADAAAIFDKIDSDHDGAINRNELSSFLDSYRRTQINGPDGGASRTRVLTIDA